MTLNDKTKIKRFGLYAYRYGDFSVLEDATNLRFETEAQEWVKEATNDGLYVEMTDRVNHITTRYNPTI